MLFLNTLLILIEMCIVLYIFRDRKSETLYIFLKYIMLT